MNDDFPGHLIPRWMVRLCDLAFATYYAAAAICSLFAITIVFAWGQDAICPFLPMMLWCAFSGLILAGLSMCIGWAAIITGDMVDIARARAQAENNLPVKEIDDP